MKWKTLIAAFLLSTTILYAEQKAVDPIDVKMNEAIEENPSTAGISEAATTALDAWKKDIESSLGKLKKAMSAEESQALDLSQKAWEVFVRTELNTQDELYSRMAGSMWVPASVMSAMMLYKERALKLRDYLETIAERGE